MSATPRPWTGYLLVIAAAVLFGLNAGISRIPLRSGTSTEAFTSVRITGAFLVLVVIVLLVDRSALRPPRGRAILLVAGLGIVGVVGLQWTYNVAIDRLPLGIALLVEYLGPVWVVLWVRFVRRESVDARMWPALGLAVVGLAVVGQVWTGLAFDGLGLTMAFAAGLCFAAYFLLGEHDTGGSPLHVIVWSFGFAAALMTILEPAWTVDSLGVDASVLGRFDDWTVPAWAAMTCVVLMGTVAPFFLLLLALRRLPATVVSVVAMLEPVVAVVVGWAWFAEALSTVQVLGVVVLLTGIVLAQTARTRSPAELPVPG